MSYKKKLRLKFFMYHLLGIVTLFTILIISWLSDRLFEMIVVVLGFYLFRSLFGKQYHSKSLLNCSFVSIVVFTIISNIVMEFSVSILCSIVLSFLVTYISYLVRDYIDDKILIKELRKTDSKCLENLTENEMIEMFPKIRYEVIHIVYGYLHRDVSITCSLYSYKNNISEATMYRYLKLIKSNYEKRLSRN